MAEALSLTLQQRTVFGKKAKHLRESGITPIHLYGRGAESQALQGDTKTLLRTLARAGQTTALTITVEGHREAHLAFVREIQWDPVKSTLVHVDFLQVDKNRPVVSQVPVIATGDAAKIPDTTVMQRLHEIEVEALPLEMPHEVHIDLSMLDALDKVLRVRDIKLPPGVKLISEPEAVVVAFELARPEEEEKPETPVETEVDSGKGKEDEEGEEGEAGAAEAKAEKK